MGYFDKTRAKQLAEYMTSTTAGTSKEWNEVEQRTDPRDNTFDKMWNPGTMPAWIRNRGASHDGDDERMHQGQWTSDNHPGSYYSEPDLLAYQNRPAAEEPYVDALGDFFADRIARWPGTLAQKGYLHTVMHDRRSQHDIAKAEGISQAAVSQGISRAIESFVKWAGGEEALAEALRQYLVDKESHDARDRLKYLPRWVHG